jgi:threonine dehydrogenase-like Zn-dependent dehydrogenase
MHEGLKVGFDVALEMSGSHPIAFRQCVDTLIMGGGMAMLGIPSKPMETDWGQIILKALTIKGVYGREMFTYLAQDAGPAEGRARPHAADHPPDALSGLRAGL